ncbi:hypothetical protein [Bacillus suaedae]|uniref:Uncharacterized protein n=1 Tax=Halalkalibacter suaedae TaxID=2822140 RepID=A0A940WUR9_9BACI|nr:hypothetical protein [Bacillus suaedae]MBP3953134.1 hypothetical protein [Bacillus suaedae]
MEQIKIGAWTIAIDVGKTTSFYDECHLITEDCKCDYCANYVLACEKLPQSVKDLFHSLGIDPRKEGEVSHYLENKDGTHLYHVFYHIVGTIIEGPELWAPTTEESETSSPNCVEQNGIDIGFSEDLDLVPEEFPTPTIQFEIQMNVPWIFS